jgi:hypothetical protein
MKDKRVLGAEKSIFFFIAFIITGWVFIDGLGIIREEMSAF